jgi:hypothetical protein
MDNRDCQHVQQWTNPMFAWKEIGPWAKMDGRTFKAACEEVLMVVPFMEDMNVLVQDEKIVPQIKEWIMDCMCQQRMRSLEPESRSATFVKLALVPFLHQYKDGISPLVHTMELAK